MTEIGLHVLDTRDLEGIPADASLEEILKYSKPYHFRMRKSPSKGDKVEFMTYGDCALQWR